MHAAGLRREGGLRGGSTIEKGNQPNRNNDGIADGLKAWLWSSFMIVPVAVLAGKKEGESCRGMHAAFTRYRRMWLLNSGFSLHQSRLQPVSDAVTQTRPTLTPMLTFDTFTITHLPLYRALFYQPAKTLHRTNRNAVISPLGRAISPCTRRLRLRPGLRACRFNHGDLAFALFEPPHGNPGGLF